MQNTSRLVIEALAKTLNISDQQQINTSDQLKEDLGLDSMSSLSFLMALEEMVEGFYVDPDTLDGDNLATVATITAYVDQQLSAVTEA